MSAEGCRHHLTADELTRYQARSPWWAASPLPYRPERTVPVCHDWPVLTIAELRTRFLDRQSSQLREWWEGAWHDAVALSEWQAGRCAICGTTFDQLVEDHDHRTALVRGWLCRSCNTLEGFDHDGEFALYRARPPAAILGIEVVYWSPFTGYAVPELEPDEQAKRQAVDLVPFPFQAG